RVPRGAAMNHPSELTWMKAVSKDLGFWRRRAFEKHLKSCAECHQEWEQLKGEAAAFQGKASFAADAEKIWNAARGSNPTPWGRWMMAASSVAALVVAVVVFNREKTDDLQAKGGDSFVLYVLDGSETHVLGDACAAGQKIRARFKSERPYLLILGSD